MTDLEGFADWVSIGLSRAPSPSMVTQRLGGRRQSVNNLTAFVGSGCRSPAARLRPTEVGPRLRTQLPAPPRGVAHLQAPLVPTPRPVETRETSRDTRVETRPEGPRRAQRAVGGSKRLFESMSGRKTNYFLSSRLSAEIVSLWLCATVCGPNPTPFFQKHLA